MTKKHFIAMADAIRDYNATACTPFTEDQLSVLARFCRRQNGAFNWSRWFGYIKGENGPCGGQIKS